MQKIAVVVLHGVADQGPGDTLESVVALMATSAPSEVKYERGETRQLTIPVSWAEDAGPYTSDAGISLTQRLLHAGKRETTFYRTQSITMERSAGAARAQVDFFEMYWADLSRLSGSVPRIVSEVFTLIFRLSRLGLETAEAHRDSQKPPVLRWTVLCKLHWLLDRALVYFIAPLTLVLSLLGLVVMGLGTLRTLSSGEHTLLCEAVLAAAIAGVLWWCLYHADHAASLWRFRWLTLALPAILLWVVVKGAIEPLLVLNTILAFVALAIHFGILTIARRRFDLHLVRAWSPALVVTGLVAWLAYESGRVAEPDDWIRYTVAGIEFSLMAIKYSWVVVCAVTMLLVAVGLRIGSRDRGDYAAVGTLGTARLGALLSIISFVLVTSMLWAAVSAGIGLASRGVAYRPALFPLTTLTVEDADEYASRGGAWNAKSGTPHVEVRRCEALEASTRDAAPEARVSTSECLSAAAQRATDYSCAAPADPRYPLQAMTRCKHCCFCELPALPRMTESTDYYVYADAFLQDRYEQSTLLFGPIALLFLLLSAWAVALFAPSAVAEGNKPDLSERRGAARLGKWLTRGYRFVDVLLGGLVTVAASLGLVVMLWFTFPDALRALLDQASDGVLHRASATVGAWSRSWLGPFIISAASIGAVLVLFGGVISRFLPALRGPLDVMLDVDNYMRSFSDSAFGGVPRAKIFNRFYAVWLRVKKYDKVVIVAHSQGSAIAADFLRWRCHCHLHRDPTAGEDHWPVVELVTFGSPLRQLYAARFPQWYGWMLRTVNVSPADPRTISGPVLEDLGVTRWLNGYCSGDYVGRWIWSDGKAETIRGLKGHPHSDAPATLWPGPGWPEGASYAPFEWKIFDQPAPGLAEVPSRIDACLGYGAHTRYFDVGCSTTAWMIDSAVK